MSALEITSAVILVLGAHFIADFVGQSDEMATNKSKSNAWLCLHVAVYTLVVGILVSLLTISHGLDSTALSVWIFVNSAIHLLTDYFTSRWTARLLAAGDRHNFFVVIGLDQLLHQATLIVTLALIVLPR